MFLIRLYNDLYLPATLDNYKIKSSKFNLYYKKQIKLNNWLIQLNFYFKYFLKSIPKTDKVFITTIFIKNKTFFWITFNLQKYLNKNIYIIKTHNSNKQTIKTPKYIDFENYKKFKKRIYTIFKPINKKLITKNVIQQLQQIKLATDYVIIF